MLKILIDETITFMFAFAFVMPWMAVTMTHEAFVQASALASGVGVVHVASASAISEDSLQTTEASARVSAHDAIVEAVRAMARKG